MLRMGPHVVAGRDEAYMPATRPQFDQFPGLGLTVHEIVTNGDRLAMRFSEHGASVRHGGAVAVWGGLGLYAWNGRRLVSNWVEQDYLARRRQLAAGVPARPSSRPRPRPWDTVARPPDPAAEAAVRAWLAAGRPGAEVVLDDGTRPRGAGRRGTAGSTTCSPPATGSPSGVTETGRYRGGLAGGRSRRRARRRCTCRPGHGGRRPGDRGPAGVPTGSACPLADRGGRGREPARIGLYSTCATRRAARPWPDVYAEALRRIAEAEPRGMEAVWLSEHHGFADGYLPAPLTVRRRGGRADRAGADRHRVVIAPFCRSRRWPSRPPWSTSCPAAGSSSGSGRAGGSRSSPRSTSRHGDRYQALEPPCDACPALAGRDGDTAAGAATAAAGWAPAAPRGPDRRAHRSGAALARSRAARGRTGGPGRAAGTRASTARLGGLVNIFLADDPDAAKEEVRAAGRPQPGVLPRQDDAAAEPRRRDVPQAARAHRRRTPAAVRSSSAASRASRHRRLLLRATSAGCRPDLVDRHLRAGHRMLPLPVAERMAVHAGA